MNRYLSSYNQHTFMRSGMRCWIARFDSAVDGTNRQLESSARRKAGNPARLAIWYSVIAVNLLRAIITAVL